MLRNERLDTARERRKRVLLLGACRENARSLGTAGLIDQRRRSGETAGAAHELQSLKGLAMLVNAADDVARARPNHRSGHGWHGCSPKKNASAMPASCAFALPSSVTMGSSWTLPEVMTSIPEPPFATKSWMSKCLDRRCRKHDAQFRKLVRPAPRPAGHRNACAATQSDARGFQAADARPGRSGKRAQPHRRWQPSRRMPCRRDACACAGWQARAHSMRHIPNESRPGPSRRIFP